MIRPRVGRWLGYAWLAFAGLNLVDLAVRGNDRAALLLAAALLAVSALVYVTALRPRVVADDAGVRIANPLRDITLSWDAVASVEATDSVVVRTSGGSGYRCWVVHAPSRQRTRRLGGGASVRPPRPTGSGRPGGWQGRGQGSPPGAGSRLPRSTRADEVATQLDEMARSSRSSAKDGGGESVRWSRPALAVLGAGALVVLASLLVP